MRVIFAMNQGERVDILVSDEDFEWLNGYNWFRQKNGYIWRNDPDKRGGKLYIHREIMGLTVGDSREVDHRNLDRLDNRRKNLKVCTPSQNCQNQREYRPNAGFSSPWRGVSWDKRRQKWRAEHKIRGSKIWRRFFEEHDDALAAVRARRAEVLGG